MQFNDNNKVCDNTTCETKSKIGKCRKSSTIKIFYAGLIVCYVPSVICESDWSRLTYESIYNTTNYVQIQNRPRPYNITSFNNYHTRSNNFDTSHNTYNSFQDTKGNELDYEEYEYKIKQKDKLLVGFARDPFRYSIPKEDYLRGVRTINPDTYTSKTENRGKRGVLHLANMINCATGCDPLSYKGYGCYCGFLGSGKPTDGIDRCCKLHDRCYENIYCPFFTVYFQPYYWKCFHGEPLCALENFDTQHQFINGCAGRLCECDRKFAMCVKKYTCPNKRALCRSSPLRLLQNILMFR